MAAMLADGVWPIVQDDRHADTQPQPVRDRRQE